MGIIQERMRGPDGFTRSALVKTNSGVSSRPVAKLYPLELNVGHFDPPQNGNDNCIKEVKTKRQAAVAARQKIQSQLDYLKE